MSSARKRAAIHKANKEANHLRQRLMLAENHITILRTMAEAFGRGGDVMVEALRKIASPTQTTDLLWWQTEAREALAKVGAGETAPEGHNADVTGAAPHGKETKR
ncbi:MAG: hypothetical protein Q7T94_11360 [Rugosibacter sp.]|nr:hypothetical protein [Rugosibacter sp.]